MSHFLFARSPGLLERKKQQRQQSKVKKKKKKNREKEHKQENVFGENSTAFSA